MIWQISAPHMPPSWNLCCFYYREIPLPHDSGRCSNPHTLRSIRTDTYFWIWLWLTKDCLFSQRSSRIPLVTCRICHIDPFPHILLCTCGIVKKQYVNTLFSPLACIKYLSLFHQEIPAIFPPYVTWGKFLFWNPKKTTNIWIFSLKKMGGLLFFKPKLSFWYSVTF